MTLTTAEERHSVNCYYCGQQVDERECEPADQFNGGDGGSICPSCRERQFGYAEAEAALSNWDYHSLPDGENIIAAINKGLQAIRDCLDMGLNGYGD